MERPLQFKNVAVARAMENRQIASPSTLLFAANEGVLLRGETVATLRQSDPILSHFSQRWQSIPAGSLMAVSTALEINAVRQAEGKTLYRHYTRIDGEYFTSIGASYYAINNGYAFGMPTIEGRQSLLAEQLREDASLFARQPNGRRPIDAVSELPPDQQVQASLAILQNVSNDASAIVYALRLAETVGFELTEQHQMAINQALAVETAYYRMLFAHAGHNNRLRVPQRPNPSNLMERETVETAHVFFTQAQEILTEVGTFFRNHTLPNATPNSSPDYLRNRREVEGLVAIEAAIRIAEQLQQQHEEGQQYPAVVVGGLGPMSMQAALTVALEAYGIDSPIVPVIPDVKEIIHAEGGKRRITRQLPLSSRFIGTLARTAQNRSIVLVDDSFGTGRTIVGFGQRLQQAGFAVNHVYIVQANDRGTNDNGQPLDILQLQRQRTEELGAPIDILFRSPLISGLQRGDDANLPRATTSRWILGRPFSFRE